MERPSEGDITEQKFRSAIVCEIDDIKSKLDGFSKKDLLANISFFEEGIELLNEAFDKARCRSEPGQKNPRSKDKNQQQTQPTYDTRSGNRARATLVGGERDHHCATSAPQDESATRVLANAKERFKDALTTSDRMLAMEH